MAERRKDPRALASNYQERRRAAALEQQASARARAVEGRRRPLDGLFPAEAPQAPREPAHPAQTSGNKSYDQENEQKEWAAALMAPEWLIEVPTGLGDDWYALPRPEGPRCLVVASRGHTIARGRTGAVIDRFPSGLPGGGPGARGGDACVLDCVFHAPDQTYYVLDLLCWRGHDLTDCTTEFRFFWLHSKLDEDVDVSKNSGRRFAAVPAFPAAAAGLRSAYAAAVPFTRDGLLLVHRRTQYSPGQTPLALLWKDAACSRYFLDTDAAGAPLSDPHCVLRFRDDRGVATADEPPIVLATMPADFVADLKGKLRPGRLLRFRVGAGGVAFGPDGAPAGADLHFVGVANQRRGRADTVSKILFQIAARRGAIAIEALALAAGAGGGGGPEGGGAEAASIGVARGGDVGAVSDTMND